MNILGVSPVEVAIICVLGLIIFGPERLPEIGRFLGRTVAQVLAWQQTSPEAQLLAELRQDIEKEILEIRDEMVRARQQLDLRPELQQIQRETEALIKGPPPTTLASASSLPSTDQLSSNSSADPDGVAQFADQADEGMQSSLIVPAPALLRAEVETLTLQVQALMADLHALQEQLRQHGMLDPDWQPPSHTMQQEDNVGV